MATDQLRRMLHAMQYNAAVVNNIHFVCFWVAYITTFVARCSGQFSRAADRTLYMHQPNQ